MIAFSLLSLITLPNQEFSDADLRNFLQRRAVSVFASSQSERGSEAVLSQVRTLQEQILLNGTLWRMSQDQAAKTRAMDALAKTSQIPMGGVEDVLANAELVASMAMGYDLLKGELSSGQKEELLKQIRTRGLQWSLDQEQEKAFWSVNWRNSSLVIRSSMALAAALTHSENSELSDKVLDSWRMNVPRMRAYFGEDGGSSEGLVYWTFVVNYAALADRAVADAKGPEFAPRLSERADALYPVMLEGPTGRLVNFGDSIEKIVPAGTLMLLAEQQEKPAAAAWARRVIQDVAARPADYTAAQLRFLPVALMRWSSDNANNSALPLAKLYRGDDTVGVMRSSWSDPNAAFVAFLAGERQASHSQVDLGSFVYEVNKVRWAIDPGMDSGEGYFDARPFGRRWDYLRTSAAGHSLLEWEKRAQAPKGSAKVTQFSAGNSPYGIVDLSQSYGLPEGAYKRGFMLVGDSLVIQDEFTVESAPATWRMMTEADPSESTQGFKLSQGGQQLFVEMKTGGLEARNVRQGAGDRKVGRSADSLRAIEFKVSADTKRIVVVLSPREGQNVTIKPLSEW